MKIAIFPFRKCHAPVESFAPPSHEDAAILPPLQIAPEFNLRSLRAVSTPRENESGPALYLVGNVPGQNVGLFD